MAAHIITALNQIEHDVKETFSTNLFPALGASLHFSTWTEDLDIDDFISLSSIVSDNDEPRLLLWVHDMKNKYLPIWEQLGKPTCREEWLKAKYGI